MMDPTAIAYDNVKITQSSVGPNCPICDNCDIIRSTIEGHSTIGRRNLLLESEVGLGSYTGSNSEIRNTSIGRFCNISWNVSIGGADHPYRSASMYSDVLWRTVLGSERRLAEKPRCIIGNDVWIASTANILGGVEIGDGAVVGAGAVVVEDVPPYAIVVGVPARILKYRFDDSMIARLRHVAWWDWSFDKIKRAEDLLRCDLSEAILSRLEKLAME